MISKIRRKLCDDIENNERRVGSADAQEKEKIYHDIRLFSIKLEMLEEFEKRLSRVGLDN